MAESKLLKGGGYIRLMLLQVDATSPREDKLQLIITFKVITFSSLRIFTPSLYYYDVLGWQLSNCGFFLENQRQFFHGTK